MHKNRRDKRNMIFLFCFISQIISLLLVVNTMTFNCMKIELHLNFKMKKKMMLRTDISPMHRLWIGYDASLSSIMTILSTDGR
jgi:hypothetical protein